jgi:hypothetical protein
MSRLAVIGYPHETKRELVAAWCAGGVEDELLGGFTVLTVNGPVEFDGWYSLPRRDAYAAIAEALGLAPTGLVAR